MSSTEPGPIPGLTTASTDPGAEPATSTAAATPGPAVAVGGIPERVWLRRLRGVVADTTPLRGYPAYRRLWSGLTISALGQQMTAVAVAVQVFALTGSSFAVGLVGICSLVPMVGFGLIGGAIVDSHDRRRVGLFSATGLAVCSVALAAVSFAGVARPWILYAVVAGQGAFFAINSPARSAMIPRLLPQEQLAAANGLSAVTMNLGTTVGPMVGGLLIGAAGYQWAYLTDAVAFLAALYAMWRLPSLPPEPVEPADTVEDGADDAVGSGRPRRASVMEGLRFLRGRPNILMTFVVDLVAMVFGMPRALFPAIAEQFYGGGSFTVGLLVAAPAVGALLGALLSGPLPGVRRQGLAVLLAVAVWGGSIAVFGFVRVLWLGLLLLAVAGCADTVSMVFRNTILQVGTPDALRGRLQGVFGVVVAGGPRLGDFESGTVASLAGTTVSVVSGGLACIAGVAALAVAVPRFARYDADDPQP